MKLWYQRGFFTFDNPPMKAENEDVWLKLTERSTPAPFVIPVGQTIPISLYVKPVVSIAQASSLPLPLLDEPQWYYIDKQGIIRFIFIILSIIIDAYVRVCHTSHHMNEI
jgi:hypothetical protein